MTRWWDMHRAALTWCAALGGTAWFAFLAPPLARSLEEARAHSVIEVQLHDVILAIALAGQQDPAALPHGAQAGEARELLEQALLLDAVKSSWPQQAAVALGPELLETARSEADRPAMPRSRAHPNVPSELLALEQTLARRFGSWGGPAPPVPPEDLWSGFPPDDQAKGLLAVAESQPLSQQQARGLQGAVLLGLGANDAQPALVDALAELLGPSVLARAPASRDAPDPDLVARYGPPAIEILRRRQSVLE